MENNQMPPVQTNVQYGSPTVQREALLKAKANKNHEFIKTIVIVVLGLLALTFIVLFVWILVKYNDVNDDVQGKIAVAVASAKEEQQTEDEKEFAEREKDPYQTFSGPADYGELTFKYPRTWSVYIEADASNGGDFKAYLNPIQVNPISKTNINALRVTIRDKDFESVAAEYQRVMERKDADLSVETISVAGAVANRYSGKIPNTELRGYIVVFKIRDKTAVLQTESVLFESDFNRLLTTISFNA